MKKIEKICKNCQLFNKDKSECNIVIIHEGEYIHIPVDPKDSCFFENNKFTPDEKFSDSVKQVTMWVENEKGERIDGDGIVKIEYPI